MSGWRAMVEEILDGVPNESPPWSEAAKTAETAKTPGAGTNEDSFDSFDSFGSKAALRFEALAERAAIIQEGAGVPAEWAEGFARLSTAPCPQGIADAAWQGMIDAAGRFLDQWGANAATLGWTAAELFGLDPHAPTRRLDRRGAAFFLVDAEVLAVTADLITIRKGGSVLKIPRRAALTAPAWGTFQ